MDLKNSMLLANMMSQKPKIMYATIKGTLTESPSGVFSGFSTSNYITMPITPSEISNCSIKLRFTTANVNTEQDIIWLKRNNENIASYFGLQVHPNGNHCYMYSYTSGGGTYVHTSFMLLSNTTYDCVINIENGKLSWKIGEPNNLIEQNQMNFDISSIASFDNPICFGSLLNTGYAFNGSIDFNNSYIILNGTKYNLQAVVGYTIVGSPTITDGVVSGFSSSNYLQISDFPTYTQDDKIEIVFNFSLISATVGNNTLMGGTGTLIVSLITASGKMQYYGSVLGLSGQTGANTLVVNQNYYFKAIYDTTSFKAYISTDGTNWVLDYSKNVSATFSRSGVYEIGRNSSSSNQYLRGSIDLNETYIKINDKLVFNGQQA